MFVAKALLSGADGVLVSGCHPRDCHYSEGNFYARRRLEMLRRFLPIIGVDEGRFEYIWVSASEGSRWRDMVTAFTDKIHKLGHMPRMTEPARTMCALEGMLGQSLAQPDMGHSPGGHSAGGHSADGHSPDGHSAGGHPAAGDHPAGGHSGAAVEPRLPDWSKPAEADATGKEDGNG